MQTADSATFPTPTVAKNAWPSEKKVLRNRTLAAR
jgi:hypothetical protein